MLQLILFDLDGTMLDTAPDLGLALNMQRQRHGLPAMPQVQIRPHASHGSKGLLAIGFGLTPEHANFNTMRTEYLDLYDQVFTRSPVLFDGIPQLLQDIERAGLRWGVVTNKPRRFTQPLLKAIGLEQSAACIISGDDAIRVKPHPDTLLLACEQTTTAPQNCLYVGDAERDIQAAHAAQMRTVIARYGYLDVSDQPEKWGADAIIDTPSELTAFFHKP